MTETMDNKRILIISHNIIDSSNNVGKTVISLLRQWPAHLIYSIYLRNEIRETMLCKESYMITDKDIIKNTLLLSPEKCGTIVTQSDKLTTRAGNSYAYRVGNKRYPIVSLIRDVLWHKKSWKNDQIKNWINKISPDLLFFIPNDYTLAFEIANYVKDLTNAPMITFFTDDSFYYHQKTPPIDKIRRRWLLKEGRTIVSKSNGMICASDLMRDEYIKIFGKDSLVLGNCVELTEVKNKGKEKNKSFVFSYVGNLHSNRWESLLEVGRCLDTINSEEKQGTKYEIDVYTTSDLGGRILKLLHDVKSINMKGSVKSSDVKEIQEQSDALVHLEAFDTKSKLSTRLSMSTKIFEYMSRNVPIFAYGPSDISSISFLAENNFAYTCSNKDILLEKINKFVGDPQMRDDLCSRSYLYAKEHFEEGKISSEFINYAKKIMLTLQ